MFVYHYRIYDRYKRRVASIAILGDEREAGGRISLDELWEVSFVQVSGREVADYQQWSAGLALTPCYSGPHLKAQATRQVSQERFEWKLAIPDGCKKVMGEDVINLFGFIDWVMSLPDDLEQEFRLDYSN